MMATATHPMIIHREPTGAPEISPSRVRERLSVAIRRAQGVPIGEYEELDDRLPELVQQIGGAIGEAMEALAAALAYYDDEEVTPSVRGFRPRDAADGLCTEVERRMDRADGIPKITGIAFMARLGLKSRLTAIAAIHPARHKWELIEACSSAVREILKALSALDLSICSFEGLDPGPSFYVTEIQRSLRVRAAYWSFRRDLVAAGPPADGEVRARLRKAASSIAKLAGRDIYPSMRVGDRAMLREFQAKIRGWLVQSRAESDGSICTGQRLYQDLVNLAELMLHVNRRAELVEHDLRVLARAEAHAAGGEMLAELEALRGRDPHLDALLESPERVPAQALREVLASVRRRLERTGEERPAIDGDPGGDAWSA